MPTALITGITGQDGAYLAQLLLRNGYDVVGMVRQATALAARDERLRALGIADDIRLVEGDLVDPEGLLRLVGAVRPDEVYNLGAQSSVAASWREPGQTGLVTAVGAANLLAAVHRAAPAARFCQASSSEMFGRVRREAQNEATPFHPQNPYAAAKLHAHWLTVSYRASFGLHASSAILFNHESPLRGIGFVTRRITDGVARIRLGLARELRLGNLDARRDWGHARDHVRALWLMLRQDTPGDYVIATGRNASVRDFARLAFAHAGLDWEAHVTVSDDLLRPAEVDALLGDPTRARTVLGWEPTVSLAELAAEMVDADLARLREHGETHAHCDAPQMRKT